MRIHSLSATGLVLAGGLFAGALAQPAARVTAAGDTLTVRSCSDAACRVVAELSKGQSVEVLKTENGWHRVLVTLEGARATTGWVEIAKTIAAAPRPAARYTRPAGERQTLSGRPAGDTAAATPAPSECLTCVATRTATTAEWNAALAAAANVRPIAVSPPPTAATAGDARSASSARADIIRRDGRTSMERMRDEFDARYGAELKQLSEVAAKLDPDLQSYMATCYDRFQPVAVLPRGPTPPGVAAPPPRLRASMFDLWRGRPAFAWNQSWSSPATSGEGTTFCQGMWNDVSTRAASLQAAVARIETAARDADIFPGVVRDALMAYGLSDGK
jgi:hypothetical protein